MITRARIVAWSLVVAGLVLSAAANHHQPVAAAQGVPVPEFPAGRVLTQREQDPMVRGWIEKRFATLLPGLMRREAIDMWIIISREYNEDPVFRSISPITTYASRRRTILVFFDRGGEKGVERLSVGRFDYEGLYPLVRTVDGAEWDGLRTVVEERDPKVIGINTSETWSHADGLTANEKENLVKAIGPKYTARLKSAERLAVGWLEVKLPEETVAYRHAMKVAHQVIAEAFSNKVVTPGKTTVADVSWWMRQHVAEMGLGLWFQPGIDIVRQGGKPAGENTNQVIQPGDMIHCDFGIVYLGFCTDTQHLAYVLKPGETDAPEGLKAGLRAANRLQEITLIQSKEGLTGNAVLAAALAQAKQEGLTPSIYCHLTGSHGHEAGAWIGQTDHQDGLPGKGDYVMRLNMWNSIELNVTHKVKEWGDQPVRFAEEEDAVLTTTGWEWVDGRQTKFYLIKSDRAPGRR